MKCDKRTWLLALIVLGSLSVRVGIYSLMHRAGWFYGKPWDTFSRTYLAWWWAQHPYFGIASFYWPPLQFWLVGTVYAILRPVIGNESNLFVPVAVNTLFMVGSLIIVCLVAKKLGGIEGVVVSAVLGVTFAQDIFSTYSGLSEPVYVFWILLGSWIVYARNTRKSFPVELGFVGSAAAATHYIGWFAALFWAGLLGVKCAKACMEEQVDRTEVMLSLLGLVLILSFPIAWAFANWRVWHSPLHFITVARNYQAGYVGALSLGARIVIVPWVFIRALGLLAVTGVMAVIWLVLWVKHGFVRFVATAAWTLAVLWISTVSGLSAPYQEPRYMTVFGWVLIASLGAVLGRILVKEDYLARGAVVVTVGLLAIWGLVATFGFTNSFDTSVERLGLKLRDELRLNPTSTVIVETGSRKGLDSTSFVEHTVIPVVSGFPARYRFIPAGSLISDQVVYRLRRGDLGLTDDLAVATALQKQGFCVARIGKYFLVQRK